jgi:hypothetical protein
MTQALDASVFSGTDRYLRVWFSTSAGGPFTQLGDQRISSVPFALQAEEAANADTLDGAHASALEESSEIDADISAHAAIADAHHARYTDSEAWAAVLANDGSGSGLDADFLDGYHASDFAQAAHVHDDRYYTRDELETSGSASVHWDNLTSVPDGFADGVDDVGVGAADVRAGDGLTRTISGSVVTLTVQFAGTGSAITVARSDHGHDHDSLSGLGADDHTQYFHLSQNETVTGRPTFEGGDASNPPFTVDSNTLVENLNADLLDGKHESDFAPATHNHDDVYWSLTGNSGTTPGTNFLGTTDAVSLTLRVSNTIALRLVPAGSTPNIIGGYSGNSVTSGVKGAAIGGGGAMGLENEVTGDYGTIGGGKNNRAGSDDATVGGGGSNTASGHSATVGGGLGNNASGHYATVGGGWSNNAGYIATVGGGLDNDATEDYATVGGGYSNKAKASYATIAGGGPSDPNSPTTTNNVVYDDYGTIGGGGYNRAGSDDDDTTNAKYATVGGGKENTASGSNATVGGGADNTASGPYATVGGGAVNTAGDEYATVGGGAANTASAEAATVGGGGGNEATADFATVPGGFYAKASHYGQMAYASGQFKTPGDAQFSLYVMSKKTTSTGTWEDLYLDGSSALLTIESGRTLTFDILVVGRSDAGESAGYQIYGVIENFGGKTSLIASTVTTIGEDDAAWNAQVSADDTNDALRVQVKGAGENIRWVAVVRTAEVSW